ncbi:TPA: hypothetical protein ACK1AU_002610 [Staphylococcus aureus]
MQRKFLRIISLILLLGVITNILYCSIIFAADDKDKKDEMFKDPDIYIPDTKYNTRGHQYEGAEQNASQTNKNQSLEDLSVWTLYAQFLMDQKNGAKANEDKAANTEEKEDDKEEDKGVYERFKSGVYRSYQGSVAGIIGKGATTLDIPYNKMKSLANDVRGYKTKEERDNAGTQLASFLSTFNHYGYIDTMSGQSVVGNAQNSFSGAIRAIFGAFIAIALIISACINTLQRWFIDALIHSNPLALMNVGKAEDVTVNNPISDTLRKFFENMGLTGEFWDSLSKLGLTLITLFFIISAIWYLMRGSRAGVSNALKQWIVRTLGVVIGLYIILFFWSAIGTAVSSFYKNTNVSDDIVKSHLFNTRGWAASSNLSPGGLKSDVFPNATANQGHVDKNFDPIRSRDLITDINNTTYETLYDMSKGEASFDLLNRWMANENFNVNTYIGDIKRGNISKGEALPAFDNYKEEFGKGVPNDKWDNGTIEYSMWSATQNVDDELRKVDSKHFKPASEVGVRNYNSFSTQSVVLMLQSSFDSNGAKFYAYNIGPTGLQASMKNLTTLKTEWKEVTLPGDGAIGTAGSYISLAADAVTTIIMGIGVILALLTLNFWESFKRIGINAGRLASYGDPFAIVSIVFGSIMFVISLVLAGMASNVFIKLANDLASALDKMTLGYIPSGFIEIVIALAKVFAAYVIAIRKPEKGLYPPLKGFIAMPLEIWFKYDDRIKHMNGSSAKDIARSMQYATKDASGLAGNLSDHTSRSFKSATAGYIGGAAAARYGRKRNGNLNRHGLKSAKETAMNMYNSNKKYSEDAYNNGLKSSLNNMRNDVSNTKGQSRAEELRALGYTDQEINAVLQEEAKQNSSHLNNEHEMNGERNLDKQASSFRNDDLAYETNNDNNIFSNDEGSKLKNAKNFNEFADVLSGTNNGMYYAFNTNSAKQALEGTEFIDNDGNVDLNAVRNKSSELARIRPEDRTSLQRATAGRLDKAFNSGAKELYEGIKGSNSGITTQNGLGGIVTKSNRSVKDNKGKLSEPNVNKSLNNMPKISEKNTEVKSANKPKPTAVRRARYKSSTRKKIEARQKQRNISKRTKKNNGDYSYSRSLTENRGRKNE